MTGRLSHIAAKEYYDEMFSCDTVRSPMLVASQDKCRWTEQTKLREDERVILSRWHRQPRLGRGMGVCKEQPKKRT